MVTTKWVYHWERSFASNYFSFLKVKEPLINNRFDVPTAQTPLFVLFLSAGVLFDGAFSLWVSLKKGEVGRVFVKTTFDKQSRIQNSVEHLWWSLFAKTVNGFKPFSQRTSSQMFNWVLNTTLKNRKCFNAQRVFLVQIKKKRSY